METNRRRPSDWVPSAEATKFHSRSRPSLVWTISSVGCALGSVEMIRRMYSSTSRALPIGAARPVLESAQFLSRIAGFFEPALADRKDLLPVVIHEDRQR